MNTRRDQHQPRTRGLSRAALGMVVLAVGGAVGTPATAHAKSWCAYPLWVHEWGVHVFGADGTLAPPAPLPPFFITPGATTAGPAKPLPTRDLPPDGGDRDIPVLQFYAADDRAPIPVGLEVGFTGGPATAWFPAVDTLRSAADANGSVAQAGRARLLGERAARLASGGRLDFTTPTPTADPTRQLVWDRLELGRSPARPPTPTTTAWVNTLRADAAPHAGALWVDGARQSERFVFYEAHTQERVPLRLMRGDTWAAAAPGKPARRHYTLANTGPQAVHDVFVVQRDGPHTFVFFAPSIPAGTSAGFLLEAHQVDGRERAETVEHLRTLLTDQVTPTPPENYRWDQDRCVMQRDPAIPVEEAEGHRLYRHEVDALLGLWSSRFFQRPGTTIVYREDPATLAAAMPLSIYTDMFHFVLLRRAGLAVWEVPALP